MPPILDVAIGTVFVFLLFSLIVSAATEILLSQFDQRAKFLQLGLKEILCHGKGDKNSFDEKTCEWVHELCKHGIVNALSKSANGKSLPSYIAPVAFRIALFDLIRREWTKSTDPKEKQPLPPLDLNNLTEAIRALPAKSKLRESLLAFLDSDTRDLRTFELSVEGWFNATMDRTSAWYKLHAQKCMISLGLALAVVINVDTIRIVRSLSSDPSLRKAIVEQAIAYNDDARTGDKPLLDVKEKIKAFKEDVARLGGTGIPIGWSVAEPPDAWWDYLLIAMGWLLTAIAASYGAPFWFDILNRFINIRNAGKAPGEKSATNSTPAGSTPNLDR